jgi:5-formyltetrahydrofolate cyclo-ligase
MLIFLSIPQEIDTSPVLELALEGGKRVFAPRLEGENLVFCRLRSAAGPWERGPFGIREPGRDNAGASPPVSSQASGPVSGREAPLSAADFPALVLVPGLAFDSAGRRLGRGRGYYDRFLAELEAAGRPYRTLGLCTACQLVPEVPVDGWDKKMDCLCTGEALLSVRGSTEAPGSPGST